MNIGELFLSIGLKGTDHAVEGLEKVSHSIGDVKTISLESKAAILGMVYGLEQLFAASNAQALALTNFSALTGAGTEQLQRYQYAARQVGVSNEEVTQSFKGITHVMAQIAENKGIPQGLNFFVQALSKIGEGFDLKKAGVDPFYIFEKIQKLASQVKPGDVLGKAVINDLVKTFGVSEGVLAAAYQGAFKQSILTRAPVLTDNQIRSIDRGAIAWKNLGNYVEIAIAKFNAAHGQQLVSDIARITIPIIKLVTALLQLTEKVGLFQLIGNAFKDAAGFVTEITSGIDQIKNLTNRPDEIKEEIKQKGSEILSSAAQNALTHLKDLRAPWNEGLFRKLDVINHHAISPKSLPQSNQSSNHNYTANINLNGAQHISNEQKAELKKMVKETVKQGQADHYQRAYRQNPAQRQGT